MVSAIERWGPKKNLRNIHFRDVILLLIVCLFTCAGSKATLESLIAMLEAIGCFEGAEICREQGMYMLSMRTTCLPQLTVHFRMVIGYVQCTV